MRSSSTVFQRAAVAAFLIAAAVSCGEERATGPFESTSALKPGEATLVQCPTDQTSSSQELITPLLGGVVTAAGSSISLQPNAVTLPTLITVTVPASKYMEIDVQANDLLSFVFAQPVSITIDYSRCARTNIDRAPLSVWHIDPVTKQFLGKMDAVDDKEHRTITFTTGHLSAYAVAF